MTSADTNLFLYAANPASPHHAAAQAFFGSVASDPQFVVCHLVMVELYMQLRNPAVLRKPLNAREAAKFCQALRSHPTWQQVDFTREVAPALWKWAAGESQGFRHIIDARLALTLLHHGVTNFATANGKDFRSFPFRKVWNPTA